MMTSGMTTPLWCLFIVSTLPIVIAGVGNYFRVKSPGGIDNQNPRAQIAKLDGPGARAYAAQQNAWEALGLFTVAVVINHLAHGDPGQSAMAASLFVVARLAHPVAYIQNWDKVRSGIFFVAFGACIWLVVLGAQAKPADQFDRVGLHHSSTGQ